MVTRFIRKLSLFLKPLKKGDVLFGDATWWILPRPIELVLHGLKDTDGSTLYDPIPSEGCYKLTIDKDLDSYFVLDSEVLCSVNLHSLANTSYTWKKRSQPRRMTKLVLEEYLVNGLLWRE